jgi:hypothetical protein
MLMFCPSNVTQSLQSIPKGSKACECRRDPPLINEVLDLSKIEAGKLELNPDPVNLAGQMQELSAGKFHGVCVIANSDSPHCDRDVASSVWLARPIKKELHLSEKLHPILLDHDKMCRLADLDETLVRTAREFVEEGLRALAGSNAIPLSGDDQRWNLDPPGIVVWFACIPVTPNVMKNARRAS